MVMMCNSAQLNYWRNTMNTNKKASACFIKTASACFIQSGATGQQRPTMQLPLSNMLQSLK
jgi:hypothetical protein